MTFCEYQLEAQRTAARDLGAYTDPIQLVAATFARAGEKDSEIAAQLVQIRSELLRNEDTLILSLGLAGETGEVCDLLKKVHGHGKDLDLEKLKLELGDVLWYLANLATIHGFTLAEIATANVAKLQTRYPNGFAVQASQARVDEPKPGVEKVTYRTGPVEVEP